MRLSTTETEELDWEHVVAIDFGTTRTGYGFASKEDRKEVEIQMKWKGNSDSSYKNLTAILYETEPELKAVAWGYEAQALRKRKIMKKENNFEIIQDFKLELKKLEDPSNKMPTVKIGKSERTIVQLIGDFLHLVKLDIQENHPNLDLNKTKWCLTVPAIWNDEMKEAMRLAAENAGIINQKYKINSQFTLALEPEAAAVCCLKNNTIQLNDGDSFVVVDAGGGTVDITSYKIQDSKLFQQFRASGGACGGTSVDRKFWEYIDSRFSSAFAIQNFTDCKLRPLPGFCDLFYSWENSKKFFEPKNPDLVSISIPNPVNRVISKEIVNAKALEDFSDFYDEDSSSFTFPPDVMASFFDESIDETLQYAEEAIDETLSVSSLNSIDYLMLVGGYASSSILQNAIETSSFRKKVNKILIPYNSGTSIVAGAVYFAMNPEIVSKRRSNFTYGIVGRALYNAEYHSDASPSDIFNLQGETWVNFFYDFVKINQEIDTGSSIERMFPLDDLCRSNGIHIRIKKSRKANPRYESETEELGSVVLRAPSSMSISVDFVFGGTQLIVSAVSDSGESVETSVTYNSLSN